ncbi:2-hydroxyacid dehydrogenase [Pleomorphovibrio marinus]|uniref:2-hydroxyacid dehydrogenase n=1 Tax=Pleomorphovibrio marinus TaxID=2164132 RepID=UPI000E0B794B|nr:glyoxylate/hydroxypyruvate reductase A [Pleomorphovibrio marinus]
MSIAIIAPNKEVNNWISVFKTIDNQVDVEVYPNITKPEKVDVAVVWLHPHGSLMDFPNLKLICSMGSGVDHIIADPELPKGIPITRIVDPRLTYSMTNYVIMGILNYHRQIFRYIKYKEEKIWDMSDPEIDITVGVMGVGQLGGDVLDKLSALGIPAIGYGNSPKSNFKHSYYYGSQLNDFLSKVNVLVCLLPLTEKTEGRLNMELFEKCTPGTYLINVARGKHLVEEDLIKGLDKEYLSGAMLDVYRQEPLPKEHPFWDHPKIMMTPHIACITMYQAAAPQIMENYHNLKNKLPFKNQVNSSQGY